MQNQSGPPPGGSGPWGDAGVGLADGQVSGVRVPFEQWEVAARALGLDTAEGGECGVEVPMALVAAMAGLPGPFACARELSWAWVARQGGQSALCQAALDLAREAAELVLLKASMLRPLVAAQATGWIALEAATRIGGLLRGQVLRKWLSSTR